MTKNHCIAVFTAAIIASACSESDGNPQRLYLALLESELTVQLVPSKPDPF